MAPLRHRFARPAARRLRRAAAVLCALAGLTGLMAGAPELGPAAPPAAAQDSAQPQRPAADRPLVRVLEVTGAIGPATAGYIEDGLAEAAQARAALVVLEMDTPGGLSTAMRDIIHAILDSRVPVATYVAPSGARAASAGTYILYASHVAAMAPGTTLGAATPVQMGGGATPLPGGDGQDGGGEGGGQGDAQSDAQSDGQGDAAGGEAGTAPASPNAGADGEGDSGAPRDAKTAKVVNDAAAYIRALAELRGRNADWAEQAVREAATLTNSEAVARNVADLEAGSVRALVAAVDGRTVALDTGEVTLDLEDARIERAPPDWRDRLLATLTDPNVAFLLMIIGLYGLIFEFTNPGLAIPGVLGAICLLLGLYALNVLPVNYAGLGLMGVGIAFMVAEAFVPSFGALGLGGLAAFGLGSTILFDTGSGAYELSWWTILGVTALTGVVLILLIGMMVRAQRRPVSTGEDTLIGHAAEVVSWQAGRGRVALSGEYWNAVGPEALDPGQRVQVTGRQGLTLTVAARAPDRRPHDPTQPAGA